MDNKTQIQTPWGTTNTPGQGIQVGVVEPNPTTNPKPESILPPPPFIGDATIFMDADKARANAEYAMLRHADDIYREAIRIYNGAIDNWRKAKFYTGKSTPAPIFAISFAIAVQFANVADVRSLPFDLITPLYPIPNPEVES